MKYLFLAATALGCVSMAGVAHGQAIAEPSQAGPETPVLGGDQTDQQGGLADIVVTAQRRSERLQDIPMAITALSGELLERSPVTNLVDVQTSVPNLNISPRLGSGVVAIRGIGFGVLTAGAEGSVALHRDGVYQSRPFAALSGLFDVDRIEVARGPQGTLYGRNATGGAINIISKRPSTKASGYMDLAYGNYGDLSVEGAFGGALVADRLLARVSARVQERDGYGTNLTNGRDIDDLKTRAIRGMLEFRPSDSTNFLLQGDYFKRDDKAGATHFRRCVQTPCGPNAATNRGFPIPADPRDVFSDIDPVNISEDYGISLRSELDLSFADLTSLTAFREGSLEAVFDQEGTAQPGQNTREEDYKTFSQELQLGRSSGSLDWIVGLYYFHEKNFARANGLFPPFLAAIISQYFQGGRVETNAYAAFGELSYHVTPKLTLIVGGRYSKESKRIMDERTFLRGPTGPITARQAAPTPDVPCTVCLGLPDKVSFSSFSPKFGARYQFSNNQQIYATAQKGFKSGGFAIGAVAPAFDPETIWSYEAGLKASWFDRALTTNLAVYHYDYKGLQLGQAISTATVVTNAAQAKVDGVELEARLAIGKNFSIDGFGAYNHARFTSYNSRNPAITGSPILDLSGNLLPNAPKWSGKIGAQYEAPVFGGSLTVRGELFVSSRVFFTEFNNESNGQRSYQLANANIRYEGADDWYLSLYMNNIFDKTVIAGSAVFTPLVGAIINEQYLPPRTYGIRVGKKF
ncbi:TonB-dependent receptor [Sphingobium xenophagum]|uniref:TonB-dependent receptor n=1 Tax=Sphingobium xenophagum TaxID=121428 RepID=UPI00142F1069|nr:TonB-dependent receptor [Sphingobium xenophagum]